MLDPIDEEEILLTQSNEDFQLNNLLDYETILIHLDNITEKVQEELLKISPLYVLYFKNCSDNIKDLSIQYCDAISIQYIHRCMMFNDELYTNYISKCKELDYTDIQDLETINKYYEKSLLKLIVSEIDEETEEQLKFPFYILKEERRKNIDYNPLSIIRIYNPDYNESELALDKCKGPAHLNRVIFNIDLKKYPELYTYYLKKYKEFQ